MRLFFLSFRITCFAVLFSLSNSVAIICLPLFLFLACWRTDRAHVQFDSCCCECEWMFCEKFTPNENVCVCAFCIVFVYTISHIYLYLIALFSIWASFGAVWLCMCLCKCFCVRFVCHFLRLFYIDIVFMLCCALQASPRTRDERSNK